MKRMKERFRGALYRYAGCHRIDAFLKQRGFQQERDRKSCTVTKNQSHITVVPTWSK
jgi:hypothetical protein